MSATCIDSHEALRLQGLMLIYASCWYRLVHFCFSDSVQYNHIGTNFVSARGIDSHEPLQLQGLIKYMPLVGGWYISNEGGSVADPQSLLVV